ncbi:hypothetical protein BAY61_31815 (plasmid) [Prauserella marina]|uniref:Uncharacterized protein n=1 Tax=Prauserella marina TaxID=530584 RepID=A0A222W152_9PSEU|nr:hypothetical protein [Prauserella marina]ASR39875.1 hypothetical protein BAY61_31815 [Prauserella marina]PWV71369.1 hypothetical protein DES30_11285 [Prauserella marina]SDD95631.1 hypothetical protein SAMN05421630_11527 [Prauserella marina]
MTTTIHPEQWAGEITAQQALDFYERHSALGLVAMQALLSTSDLSLHAAALTWLAEGAMGEAAVAWQVFNDPVDGNLSNFTPTERAEIIEEHIEGARIVLRLAEAARAKVEGKQRPCGAWPELEDVAGDVLDLLADPETRSAKEMSALYGDLIQPLLDLGSYPETVAQLVSVWSEHAENDETLDALESAIRS